METVCPTDGSSTIQVQDAVSTTYVNGTTLAGRYRIDGVIGIGGFGAVYRCTQLTMNQTVAVKVLRNEHLTSVEHVKRFTREAQAASRLRHPNTVHIFDFGTHTDGALYLAMEYIEGETLGSRLDAVKTLPWETLLPIFIQVCHSLTEAHALPLIHRDLKPENIMLLPVAGDSNFVKVLDFGIAKMQKDPSEPSANSLTESGMIMGTPTYMSPEQARGEPIDARSDIYSIGVILYEALTGKPPFVGESPMTVLVAHIKDLPRPIPRDGSIPHVPKAVEEVVLACLEKEPARRPQSTAALVERLTEAMRLARLPVSRPAVEANDTLDMISLDDDLLAGAMTTVSPIPTTTPPQTPVPELIAPARPVAVARSPLWIGLGAFAIVGLIAVLAALLVDRPHEPVAPPATVAPAVTPAAPAPVADPGALPVAAPAPAAELLPSVEPPLPPPPQPVDPPQPAPVPVAAKPGTGRPAPADVSPRPAVVPPDAGPTAPDDRMRPDNRLPRPDVNPTKPKPTRDDFRID
jgi:serine/threonine-protein kinase